MSIEKINRRFRSSRFLKWAGALTAVAALGTIIEAAEAIGDTHAAAGANATVPYETNSPQLTSINPAPGTPEFYQQAAQDSETALKIYGAATAIGVVAIASGLAVVGRREDSII